MFKLLCQPNFGLLWFAGLISMIGDWVLFISLPTSTYNLTRSSLATSIMFMVGTLPRILLGSVSGVYVDRWDRQRTMIVADLSRVALILLLLCVRSADSTWIVYLVAFVESIVTQFFGPAETALLPQLVDECQLLTANSVNSLNNNHRTALTPFDAVIRYDPAEPMPNSDAAIQRWEEAGATWRRCELGVSFETLPEARQFLRAGPRASTG